MSSGSGCGFFLYQFVLCSFRPQHESSMKSLHSSGHDSGFGARDRSETPSESLIRIMRHRQSKMKRKCSCHQIDNSNVCCGEESR